MQDHQETTRIDHLADVGRFIPTREQDAYAESVALKYGRSAVEPYEATDGAEREGWAVITGLSLDIERSRALVSPDGDVEEQF